MQTGWQRIKQAISPNQEQEAVEFERALCAFLPGALEVQARPPSPLPRVMAGIILLMFTLLVIWACVSKVDIIASAEGKIIPTGRTKEINALQQSRVVAIHVTEGQSVQQGELLIELDQSLTGADLAQTQAQLQFISGQLKGYAYLNARMQSLDVQPLSYHSEAENLRTDDHSTNPQAPWSSLPTKAIASPADAATPEPWVLQTWQSFSSQWQALTANIHNKLAEQRLTQTNIHKLESTLPIIQERASNLRTLQSKKLVARTEYLELEQQRLSAEFELQAAKEQQAIVQASLQELYASQRQLLAETQSQYQQQYLQLQQQQRETTEEWHKAQALNNAQQLTAPVTGTVMQLTVTTLGSVVQPATPLMLIVPEDAPLEAEVLVQNKDIGFIDINMASTVKVHTFPFTQFGTLDGSVTQVSGDAVEQQQQGLLFPIKVQMQQDAMQVGERTIKLKPGMSVTAEIKIGNRRVIEFFLAPLLRYQNESVRER